MKTIDTLKTVWTVSRGVELLSEGDYSGRTNRECALSAIEAAFLGVDGAAPQHGDLLVKVHQQEEWLEAYTATVRVQGTTLEVHAS